MANRHGRTDFLPAITGFVVGGCVLFALVFGIVRFTNGLYAGEHEGTAAAATTH